MFPMVTPDGIETGGCYNHMCRAAKRSRGSSLLPLHRRLLAAAGLAFLVTSSAAFAQGGPPAMPVTISPPVAKRVTQWDEFSGRFEAVASVEVRARVSGFIDKLHFRDGQLVNVGDLLFTIDKRPFEIAVESAEAEVARNKAQVDIAELQVERGASLIKLAHHHRRRVRPAQGQPRRGARPAQDRRSGGAQCRAQPRLDRRARAARRPHLRPQGRCRQPDPGRPAGRHAARHHRHARSHPLRVRRLGIGLPALHPPVPVRRDGVVARFGESGAHPARRRDRMDAQRQGRLRRQHAERRAPAPCAPAPSSRTRTSC